MTIRPAKNGRRGGSVVFFEPMNPPLYSRRHFIPCRSCQPPKLFVPMPLSDVPNR